VSNRPLNPYRLPTHVVPTAYEIELTPNIDAATFAGRVAVTLDVREATNEIQLNSAELSLDLVTVTGSNGATLEATVSFDEMYETATFSLNGELPLGVAHLTIDFRGTLNDRLIGFYKSTYVDDAGATQAIATTQFEATDARRAFPCWDEPIFKATFDVTLHVPNELAAYSNSPIVSESVNSAGTRRVQFAPTMKMSTYLVAFVVGPFEETAPIEVLGTPLRVVVPKGKVHLSSFALEAGEFALRFFSEYFDIPYPGDKLDLVAVPDFAFGAMENLGCVTFRESALLIDPATASLAERERVADIVSHEIAHMWFGDLVTMQWWEGIWLNEAFATFMETLCVEHFKPEWKKWLSFATQRDAALQVDGLHATRAIEYEVISPADMRGMFDVLTYEKGGSVLRMLEQYLGADVFRDGIRLYLRRHSYSNTVTTDLWDALEETSEEPVREMMNTWILQGGHPLVSYDNGVVSQRAFSYGAATETSSAIGTNWLTPVQSRSANGGAPSKMLLSNEPVALQADGPMVLNAGGWGVYRTHYGTSELALLAGALERLDAIERTVLVADTWAAANATDVDWDDFLGLARGLSDLNEPATWQTVAMAFDTAARAVRDDQRATLRDQAREIFAPVLQQLTWDARTDESELSGQVRATAIALLATVGDDEAVQKEALRRFDAYGEDGDLARAILRSTGYVNRSGDYETVLERYRNAASPQDKQRNLWATADFYDVESCLDATERCFSEFRSQDGPIVLGLLMRNPVGGPDVWRNVSSRWNEAQAAFPPAVHSRIISGISTFITDRDFAAEVAAFHRANPIHGEERTVEQLLEKMKVGLDFTDALRRKI
jgi:puromycin-sensitive aminopeptidase